MPDNVSALQLRAHGRSDPAGDRPAVAPRQPLRPSSWRALIGVPSRGRRRAHALSRPRGGDRRAQCADGAAAGRRRARGLSPAVAFGPARIVGPAVHAAGDDHRPDHPRRADHRGADAADHRGLVDRVPRRARGHGCRPARAHRDPDLGRAASAWSPRCSQASVARPRRSAPSSSSAAISTASPAP